ncbi:MAG: hypothetical protein CMH56_03570 [Myxococcales bacterium]|nr:hypothetical protein [Myxococcales bacterium]
MNRLSLFLTLLFFLTASVSWAEESKTPQSPSKPPSHQSLDSHTPDFELQLWDKSIDKEKADKRNWAKELFNSEITETVGLAFGEGVFTTIMAEVAFTLIAPPDLPSIVIGPLLLLSPVVGGIVWAGGAFVGLQTFDDFRGGQLDLLRSSFVLGAANSLFTTFYISEFGRYTESNTSNSAITPLLIAFGSVATVGAGLGAAILSPISNPATGAVALSTGMTLAALVPILAAIDSETDDNDVMTGIGIAANLGYVGGAVLAQYVPIRRLDTWFWDFGAAVGAYTAFSLAVTNNAPNPTIGFGSTAFGLLAGGAIGCGLSRWLFKDVEVREAGLLNRLNWTPLVLNGYQTQKPVGGIQLQFAF